MADISIAGLNKFFGENQILYDITFDIFPGEKVAIVGPNGAGKTTLFRVLTGELPYETGTISIAKDRTVGRYGRADFALGIPSHRRGA